MILGLDHPAKDNILTKHNDFESKTIREHEPNSRRSRSVRGITSPVLKALIDTASEVPTSSTLYRKFEKHGGAGDAIADFYKMRPNDIRISLEPKGTLGSAGGFVDGTDVQLRIRKHWPTILIYTKDAGAIKIKYLRERIHVPDHIYNKE